MANWMPPSPSPQTLFSSMLGDNIGSRAVSDSTCESESGFSFHGYTEHPTDYRDELQAHSAIDQTSGFSALSEQNIGSRGGLLERMAARAGFNAPRLNTETNRPGDHSENQEDPSSYLTIPPGFSPTTLLESPVFLSNSLVGAQPSPTTGKFTCVPSGNSQNSGLFTESADRSNENIFEGMDGSSFAFRPAPSHYFGSSGKISFPSIEVSVQSENTMAPQMIEHSKAAAQNQQTGMDTGGVNMSEQTTGTASTVLERASPLDDEEQDNEADQRGGGDVIGGDAPDEDGYNWKKYGQKQVKGSDSPRSYYKCSYINCPMKKQVERSLQGHITEIVYKGIHNHPKPPAHRRSALGSSGAFGNMQLQNGEHAFTDGDVDPAWTSVQRGNIPSDWRQDSLDMTSSTMLGSQYGTGATSLRIQNNSQFEPGDAADRSSTFSNDEDADERGTHGSASVVYDGEGDESASKKRKVEAYPADMSGATRAIRESRVVVQTASEVDILDDGYRWRKYGQKIVKGNPNPRSYYKCTSAGCSVRKHIERASHDLKCVITTYEGKHNHEVPAPRNSSHVHSGNAATGVQSHVHRPEPSQLHNSKAHFDRTASLGSYGLPNRPHLIPPHDFGYGMNQRSMPNLTLGGYGGCSQGKLPFLQGQQYMGQQRPMNEMAFMLPKGVPKVGPMSNSGLSLPNASSVYQQVMMRLGPHM